MTDAAVRTTLLNTRQWLLDRCAEGHWVGRLSGSAVATAAACFALQRGDRCPDCVTRGRAWLRRTQNDDGGWGDTTQSPSNLAATLLAWCVVQDPRTEERARAWLVQQCGDAELDGIATALRRRYGDDRTFAAPILTMCILSRRLGRGTHVWRRVPALPWRLAALPPRLLRWMRVPVVSYARPALIAIGLARLAGRKDASVGGPLVRRTLDVLHSIQPTSGGFLEAAPLTAFVCMSLIACGHRAHPSVARGLDFLEASARDDGSWPIDTNLATWVSTQAVNAFAAGGAIEDLGERGEATRGWLLSQQHVNRHPYTGSRPGGWAWTDLSGGVPDADDTASVSLSLHALAPGHADVREAALAGTDWLLDLQNADGGMPTFCRGWGRLEFDRSAVDLTAHALRAWKTWRQDATPAMQRRIDRATRKGLHFIKANQSADGSFTPLWFGNQAHPNELNPTYGTARALLALAERTDAEQVAAMTSRAAAWLLDAQHEDGGWGGASGLPASIEETAVAVEALAALRQKQRMDWGMDAIHSAIAHGSDWLCEHTMRGTEFPSAPIGLYFARLWYAEQLYPAIFTAAALGRSLRLSTGGSAQTAAR